MPKQYCHMIAKAVISNADNIISAIDRYIAKADEDLANTLKEEGFANEDETVEQINTLQEKIADILREQTKIALAVLAASTNWKAAKKNISDMMDADDIADQVNEAVSDMLETQIPELATAYIKELEPDLVVDTLRWRTADWMAEWSERLGELMKINTHKQLTDLIQSAIDNGESISSLTTKIMDGGWRSEYYQARRVALTEVLRAHSVAREEAIQQSPSTDRKEWVHTGAHKNEPRQNHVDMSGQIVTKDQPFTMIGRDGATYYPRYPIDPILPASESVNCHCIHRGITNDDILGMSYEERKKMQQDIIDNDDGEWEKELDAQNKAKAGIQEYESSSKERPISHSNTKAADKWAKTHLGVTKTNYTSQDITSVNKADRAIQRIYREYPELKGFVQEIYFSTELPTSTVAAAKIMKTKDGYRTVLRLNSTYFADTKAVNELIRQQVNEGHWTGKHGIYGILKHEMTHILSYKYSLENASSINEAWKDITGTESAMCSEVKKKALEACNLTDDYDTIKEKLSKVAAQDADEFVAEAISSSKSTKLTKKVRELFEEKMR